jgi:hypothetical protein
LPASAQAYPHPTGDWIRKASKEKRDALLFVLLRVADLRMIFKNM